MNVEIGTEAAQFPEKEYINGIFVAVWSRTKHSDIAKEPPANKLQNINPETFSLQCAHPWLILYQTVLKLLIGK
jgi:hypothetical protein